MSPPIPGFDRHGNLPVGDLFGRTTGVHHSITRATLQETHARFVRDPINNEKRLEIWSGWMQHRRDLESFGIEYQTIVDGSFVTHKPDPSDVDLGILLDAGELAGMSAHRKADLTKLLAGPACKDQYHCDVYPLVYYPFAHPFFISTLTDISYWTRVFGIDRDNRQKSYLIVSERGTL